MTNFRMINSLATPGFNTIGLGSTPAIPGIDYEPGSCYMSMDEPTELGGGSGRGRLPAAHSFPNTMLASVIPGSKTMPDLQELFPDAPVQATGIKSPHTRLQAGVPQASSHIITVGDGDELVDITKAPADITIIPQWHTGPEYGGGVRGGVAQAWVNRAHSIAEDGDEQTSQKILDAVEMYETERETQLNHSFTPGTCVVVQTGVEDKSIAPAYIIHIASVPPNRLKVSSEEATQSERMIYLSRLIRNVLAQVRHEIVQHDPRLSRLKRPIRVSLPMMSTGPDGAVTLRECATILLTELGKFCEENPGYEFIVPVYTNYQGNWRRADELDKFARIMSGDKSILKEVEEIRPRTPHQMFEEIAGPYKTPAPKGKGKKLTRTYFDSKYDKWLDSFVSEIQGDLSSAKKFADRFSRASERLLVSAIYYHAILKNGNVTDKGFIPPEITEEALKEILNNPEFKKRAFRILRGALGDRATSSFAGDAKMDDFIAIVTADILEDLSKDLYEDHYEALQEKVKAAAQDVERLDTELTEKSRQLSDAEEDLENAQLEVEVLQSNVSSKGRSVDMLRRAVKDQAEASQQELQQAETELTEMSRRLSAKERELGEKSRRIRVLEDSASSLRTQQSASSSTQSSHSSRSSRYSSNYGRSG